MTFQNYFDEQVLTFEKDLDADLQDLLKKTQSKVSVIESMSGGLLAHRLMYKAGSSDYFVGSMTCYNTITQINTLGVRPKTIRQFGPVSKEVVEELLVGGRALFRSSITCVLTGVAGPSNNEYAENQVGKICFGIEVENRKMIKLAHITGNRQHIMSQSVAMVIGTLRQYLKATA